MRTREVISRCNQFKDTFGGDLSQKGHLKTKGDCLNALRSHQEYLRCTCEEEIKSIDDLIDELGIAFENE